ncbi:MAG: hypothetical protein EU539_08685 [Promethearchaeota archaeon]|nr:MAG: hypothetical protein EU539_08685 [Candidatus Lokiarchaeota archaeon]
MHINSHFAIGVIIASISHHYFNFNLIEFLLIVISSFICDLDVFFSKRAKDNNHRNLFTHSIIPSIVIIVIGLIINWPALIFSGVAYFVHVFADIFDWGTNLFYFPKKTIGPRLFLSKEEEENLEEHLAQFKSPASFFDFKYYTNKIALSIELSLFILMMISIVLLAFIYFWIFLIYFPLLYFHLSRHFHLKKLENS